MRIPEKAIAETSGHKSAKALQGYERTSSAQKQAVTASINVDVNVGTSSNCVYEF